MGLFILNTDDAALNTVQQNVKKELDALALKIPSTGRRCTKVAADYAVKLTDAIVLANPVTSCNVALPSAATCVGLAFTVKNTSAAGVVHLRGYYASGASETIDGAERLDLAAGVAATCYSDGATWWVT